MEPFLSSRLSDLGLDYETYGPYLLPLFSNNNDEDVEEEWESVLELLRASSETHSDDDEQVYTALRQDSCVHWQQLQADQLAKLQEQHEKEVTEYNQGLALEREAARQAEVARLEKKAAKEAADAASRDDAAKRAVMERYAYEPDDPEEGGDAESSEPVVNNREASAQASRERANELKKQHVTTKREEQQKTAKAKMEKVRQKEERRSRATKGERKR